MGGAPPVIRHSRISARARDSWISPLSGRRRRVTRTKVGAMIEHIKPFGVVSPQCDWDPINNKVQHYRTIGKPVQQE